MADEKAPFSPPPSNFTRSSIYNTISPVYVGNVTYGAGPFIQPYPDSQTQAKQIIIQRKDQSLGASLNSIMMAGALQREAGRDILMDARLRNLLLTIFSQEANGGGLGADSTQSIINQIQQEGNTEPSIDNVISQINQGQ